jgi:hypothetical protein
MATEVDQLMLNMIALRELDLLDDAGFELHGAHAVHPAVDVVLAAAGSVADHSCAHSGQTRSAPSS